jgi:hypothetical protein
MHTLEMLHLVVFAPKPFCMPLASRNWTEQRVFSVDLTLVALQIPGVGEAFEWAGWNCAFMLRLVFFIWRLEIAESETT